MVIKLYTVGVHLYSLIVHCASFFNKKARLWVTGRKDWKRQIKSAALDRPIWFHCASVGEFEQARPVIEQLRSHLPDKHFLLTFYSPSGFELRKNYAVVQHVAYLPVDTPANMRIWLDSVQPELVVFTKYDFWFNLMEALHHRSIPMIAISVHLPVRHWFFRWPGTLLLPRLNQFNQLFLQDNSTAERLSAHGIHATTVAGDTRVDRVLSNAEEVVNFPVLEQFSKVGRVVVAGSLWSADSALLLSATHQFDELRWIIAPHESNKLMLKAWKERFGEGLLHWTGAEAQPEVKAHHQVIYVDFVGLLSKLYRYGKVAYVGGGFGSGIHNILEPAAYGLPVIFGPKNARFQEAQELKTTGQGIEVSNKAELVNALETAFDSRGFAQKAEAYFERQKGATGKITEYMLKELL